jgi:Abi-like protein
MGGSGIDHHSPLGRNFLAKAIGGKPGKMIRASMREALLTAESRLNQWVGLVIPNLVELLGGNDCVAPNVPAGRVFHGLVLALPRIPFNKPPLSLPDQLALLVARGLTVNDTADATHYLAHIGYYRISGYALPFQVGGNGPDRHDFKPRVTCADILDRYVFDRKLRLVMDAIERIEISVRTALSNAIAARHGAHWYLKPQLFSLTFDHSRFIDDIKQQIGHAPAQQDARYLDRALLS